MLLGGRRGFRIFLVYPLPSLPPKLLETGGAENPAEEKRLYAGLKAAQKQWIAEAGQAGERALTNARRTLRTAGVVQRAVETRLSDLASGERLADHIVELTRTLHCATLVVGREAVPWFRRVARSALADALVRRAKNLSLWVVE